jgi:hypothetical protein
MLDEHGEEAAASHRRCKPAASQDRFPGALSPDARAPFHPMDPACVACCPSRPQGWLSFGSLGNTTFKSPNPFRAFCVWPWRAPWRRFAGWIRGRRRCRFRAILPFAASLLCVSLWWSRDCARGHFPYRQGFGGGQLSPENAVAEATSSLPLAATTLSIGGKNEENATR